jgi:hypothetical protein
MRSKKRIADGIALGSIGHIMPDTVDLDRQSGLSAEEIRHIGTGRMLPTKFETMGPTTQLAP